MILENHLHFIAQAPELDKCVAGFKAYTARRIIDHLQRQQAERLLQRLHFAKAAHKRDREYQFWQEGVHAEMILNEAMMRQNLDYIHANPVKRGYVNLPQHWRYSSAANYEGLVGLMEIDVWFKKRSASFATDGLHGVQHILRPYIPMPLNCLARNVA